MHAECSSLLTHKTKELLDKLVPDLANSLNSINRSIPDAIKRAMEGVKGLDDSNTKANAEAVGEAANRATESITPEETPRFASVPSKDPAATAFPLSDAPDTVISGPARISAS